LFIDGIVEAVKS